MDLWDSSKRSGSKISGGWFVASRQKKKKAHFFFCREPASTKFRTMGFAGAGVGGYGRYRRSFPHSPAFAAIRGCLLWAGGREWVIARGNEVCEV